MNKIVDFNKIGYVAATFEVDATTQAYLKANHSNAKTGKVEINGLNLAVKLGPVLDALTRAQESPNSALTPSISI